MITATGLELRALDRAGVQRWLSRLGEWLLPDSFFGVQHTWPQLYRSDGHGHFLGLFSGEQLLAHVAFRMVTMTGERGTCRAALLGSVATDPAVRGRGHASALLAEALAGCRAEAADAVLLWAERPELYARAGFVAGPEEFALQIARPPHATIGGVRQAQIDDHGSLHELHAQKPWRVLRTPREMSGLLTTPGMHTFVLERDGALVAYACCGKGADLQGWWHEFGGSDDDVARLLPAAMAAMEQTAAHVIVPPYRTQLTPRLGRACTARMTLAGPMVCALTDAGRQRCFVDGLDSV